MVTFEAMQVDRAVELLKHLPGKAQQAMARAMNRAIEGARTEVKRAVRKEYKPSSAEIAATMRLRKATPARLEAEVQSSGHRIPLFEFGPTPSTPGTGGRFSGYGMTRPPLRVSVKRKKPPGAIPGAFVAKANRLHVWRRTGKKRFPIEPLFGPAIPQMMGHELAIEAVYRRVEAAAQKRLDARMDHEIDFLLSKAVR